MKKWKPKFPGAASDGEEDPYVTAQRFINVYRQLHVLREDLVTRYNDMLLEIDSDARSTLTDIPGGRDVRDYLEYLEHQKYGDDYVSEDSDDVFVSREEKAKAKAIADALSSAQEKMNQNQMAVMQQAQEESRRNMEMLAKTLSEARRDPARREEAAELAYFGAKILHPTCVQPAKYANIPVRLLNTMEPTAPGTLISNDTEKGKIKAVAAKDNITAIKIKSSRMLLAHGFLRKVFEIFESYQTSIDMICTSEVGVSVSIDNTKHLNEILDDLKKYGTVTVDQDMCIICVVGDLEWENVGFEAKALDAMRDIPVRMISFGGSNYNISFLIREEDKKKALQSLSDHLFNNK